MDLLHGMLVMQRRDALLFRPVEDVALVMDEYAGRATVVLSNGDVAWRPGPASEAAGGFFVELRPGIFANPRHASYSQRNRKREAVFPGGWTFHDVPKLEAPAPSAHTAVPMVSVESHRLPASSIIYIEHIGRKYRIRTTGGDIPLSRLPRELIAALPHLVKLGIFYVNARRLREISPGDHRFHLRFDTGDAITIRFTSGPAAARTLGLPGLRRLDSGDGVLSILHDEGLRDWPRPILDMPAESLLPELGGDRRRTIANVLWQVVRLRSMGAPPDYGSDHRGFWYLPLFPILNKLDMLADAPVETMAESPFLDEASLFEAMSPRPFFQDLTERSASSSAYRQYQDILGDLVGGKRLFTYRDLGFGNARPDLNCIGAKRPHVVLVVEKSSLQGSASEAARRFGISWTVLGGGSTWLAVEFFAEALRPALTPGQRVQVLAYVDFDPAGWLIADSFIRQLARYGLETESLRHLVLPKCFTKAEIEALAYPIAATTESSRALVRNWIRRSGGVGKRGLGIHSDHLRPLERVLEAIRKATGLEEVSP